MNQPTYSDCPNTVVTLGRHPIRSVVAQVFAGMAPPDVRRSNGLLLTRTGASDHVANGLYDLVRTVRLDHMIGLDQANFAASR